MQSYKYTSVLTIAGSDSGGGAGIQADLKTFSALGCYGTSAITAVTAQNTLGVAAIHPIPAEIVAAQIVAVMEDIRPSAIKVGMLFNADTVRMVAETLRPYKDIPIIVDPIMVSSSGSELTTRDAVEAIRHELSPIASLITPNIIEAEKFTGCNITHVRQMKEIVYNLLEMGSAAVLLKGGHLSGDRIVHRFADVNGATMTITSNFVNSINTHGTGCTLSAAICAYIARGEKLMNAIKLAEKFVNRAIVEGSNVKTGNGSGPLNHFFRPRKLARHEITNSPLLVHSS